MNVGAQQRTLSFTCPMCGVEYVAKVWYATPFANCTRYNCDMETGWAVGVDAVQWEKYWGGESVRRGGRKMELKI